MMYDYVVMYQYYVDWLMKLMVKGSVHISCVTTYLVVFILTKQLFRFFLLFFTLTVLLFQSVDDNFIHFYCVFESVVL